MAAKRGEVMKWIRDNASYEGDDCLIWPFFKLPDGRPHMSLQGRSKRPPRVMCELVHGPPPSARHQAAHSCGNALGGCMNSRHLRWATPTENNKDKVVHGTQRRGEDIYNAKLTEDDVRYIRSVSNRDSTAFAISKGMDPAYFRKIRRRECWKHV